MISALRIFLAERVTNAAKYGVDLDSLTPAQRHQIIIDCVGHVLEEMVEFRMCVPRKPWKSNEPCPITNPEQRALALAEFADVLLLLGNCALYAGFSAEDIEKAITDKIAYNDQRLDHSKNVD